ncbi:hypothetical protein OKA05_27750 [Luteolibacter arcticus]|uniref:Uncharacterized protein n=1 Tax=Luteolibacter arcticus TaxID=1581411 RepID=A0ABT3GSB5_9BACT|nr:hypothetical protein [Luteolibacter arcticus]MCW1926377.1 hypothetical protein [Luteolibacter arcticus]
MTRSLLEDQHQPEGDGRGKKHHHQQDQASIAETLGRVVRA